MDEEEGEERYDDKQGFAESCIVRALWGSERKVNKHKRKDVYNALWGKNKQQCFPGPCD